MKFLSSLNNNDLENKICLLRVDFNVSGDLFSNPRLVKILPTIKFLLAKKAKIIILSHLGRPKHGERAASKNLSLKFAAEFLESKLKKKINFINHFDFYKISEGIKSCPACGIFLLENLRLIDGEEGNDEKLARKLASLGDFYVNDAFSVSHRKNASVAAITKFLPSYAGLLMESEIKSLSEAINNPKKPLIVILGGAKISDKLGLIKNFLLTGRRRADYFLVGGGIANTFLAAQNLPIGDSLYEKDMLLLAKKFLKSGKIILPSDVIIDERKILDIGPKTIEKYSDLIKKAKMIIWNGPVGYFEDEQFAKGSKAIAKVILSSKAQAIIGGGETTSLFQVSGIKYQDKKHIFLSTGGGAMLEFLGGKKLPGIAALEYNKMIIKT
ncbi:MAG: phosphoglycerate kinase [Patescibacteria group bacterium]